MTTMTTKRRVVIDTSVLISAALIEQGKLHATVFYVLEHENLLASSNTFHELETRLRRAKFLRYLRVEKREAYLTFIRERSRFRQSLPAAIPRMTFSWSLPSAARLT